MTIGIYTRPASMSADQYDDISLAAGDRWLQHAHRSPLRVCFGAGDSLQVFDVWESQQAFDDFGAALMPILQEVGVDAGQPMIEPVHSVIPG